MIETFRKRLDMVEAYSDHYNIRKRVKTEAEGKKEPEQSQQSSESKTMYLEL